MYHMAKFPHFISWRRKTSSSSTATSSATFSEIEQEQEWLQGLHSFISQVSSSGGGEPSASKAVSNLSDLLNEADTTSEVSSIHTSQPPYYCF